MYIGKLDRRVDRIIVDLYCSDCEPGKRCDDCQDTVDVSVASALAHLRTQFPDLTDEQITERYIHVKQY